MRHVRMEQFWMPGEPHNNTMQYYGIQIESLTDRDLSEFGYLSGAVNALGFWTGGQGFNPGTEPVWKNFMICSLVFALVWL